MIKVSWDGLHALATPVSTSDSEAVKAYEKVLRDASAASGVALGDGQREAVAGVPALRFQMFGAATGFLLVVFKGRTPFTFSCSYSSTEPQRSTEICREVEQSLELDTAPLTG